MMLKISELVSGWGGYWILFGTTLAFGIIAIWHQIRTPFPRFRPREYSPLESTEERTKLYLFKVQLGYDVAPRMHKGLQWSDRELPELSRTKKQVLSRSDEIFDVFFPQEALWYTYTSDSPREKAFLAHYTSKRFVTPGLRSFVQASSTAIYFGQCLANNESAGTMFYSNSVVFPCTVLREGAFHQVYTFCGSTYDQECGAWLFQPHEKRTAEELRRLFTRPDDPLTTVFLMPKLIREDLTICYRRPEAAFMARTLIEVASQIIIMIPANRVYGGDSALPSDASLNRASAESLGNLRNKKVAIVIAGIRSDKSILEERFRNSGLDVHWPDSPQFTRANVQETQIRKLSLKRK